jgi:hypothetical protein
MKPYSKKESDPNSAPLGDGSHVEPRVALIAKYNQFTNTYFLICHLKHKSNGI